MSTPSNNFSAFSTPVTTYAGRNVVPTIKAGQTRSSLRSMYYFKAYGSHSSTSVSGNLVLDAVDTTESSHAYSASTGVYTAPVKGLYVFEVCTSESDDVAIKVVSGGESYYYINGGHGYTTEIALEAGDAVSLYVDGSIDCSQYPSPFIKSYLTLGNAPQTTFGGRLVAAL